MDNNQLRYVVRQLGQMQEDSALEFSYGSIKRETTKNEELAEYDPDEIAATIVPSDEEEYLSIGGPSLQANFYITTTPNPVFEYKLIANGRKAVEETVEDIEWNAKCLMEDRELGESTIAWDYDFDTTVDQREHFKPGDNSQPVKFRTDPVYHLDHLTEIADRAYRARERVREELDPLTRDISHILDEHSQNVPGRFQEPESWC